MVEKVAILIPIYKEKITSDEEISLRRCLEVFADVPIYFVAPDGLTVHYANGNIPYSYFNQSFFESTQAYNRLMLSKSFYKCFIDYDYVLIYQLDAFVFENRLKEFLSSGYDYIGAPWMQGQTVYKYRFYGVEYLRKIMPFFDPGKTVYVGNGGVSLRAVKKHVEILNLESDLARKWRNNEDVFFAMMGELHPEIFRVPSVDFAMKFSFEMNPQCLYEKNGYKLPFLCHAWGKWDKNFWRVHFKKCGYDI